ncbi:hypothetical protein RirG_002850 [Rhizophagus irregularis DAOM 197198w]|uniref:Uncharacterized protein n=1 Tax=Rhizophagus irregularis (strain DAOM 197198w) TaxID=1432141 RepID=A0A015KJB6_RHIIW|nr:hypothetical protein RirG_002850 [Rhizophagus irregularis DAOM 197198w]
MSKLELSYVSYNGKVYAGKPLENIHQTQRAVDVTETFLRCVVRYCTESVEFEVDGMRFKATCERIK